VNKRYKQSVKSYSEESFEESLIVQHSSCVHLQKSGLRVWLKLNYSDLESPPEYVRDVSNIGHWGVGDVELAIDSIQRFQSAKGLIQKSFEENRLK